MRTSRAVLVFALCVALGACGSSGSTVSGPTTTTTPGRDGTTSVVAGGPTTTVQVDTEVLDDLADPPGAPGRTLTLVRYVIAPGAKLKPHIHPGVQMARIESGTLTYTVVSGTALVRRAGSTIDTAVTGPKTITLQPGDAVIEKDGMVHYGENRAKEPLVIIATLLTEDGHDLAELVTTTTAPASPADR